MSKLGASHSSEAEAGRRRQRCLEPHYQAVVTTNRVRCECGSIARGAPNDDLRCNHCLSPDNFRHGRTLCSRLRLQLERSQDSQPCSSHHPRAAYSIRSSMDLRNFKEATSGHPPPHMWPIVYVPLCHLQTTKRSAPRRTCHTAGSTARPTASAGRPDSCTAGRSHDAYGSRAGVPPVVPAKLDSRGAPRGVECGIAQRAHYVCADTVPSPSTLMLCSARGL